MYTDLGDGFEVSGFGKICNPKEMKLHYILSSTSISPYL